MNEQGQQLIEKIQSSGWKSVWAITGGGVGAVHCILSHAGASRFVLDVRIPYSAEALEEFLGEKPETARRQWLASLVTARGVLELDDGAVRVLRDGGKSLLPVGVHGLSGNFRRGDVVVCRDGRGVDIARGLCNYGAEEAQRIIGHSSLRIPEILGYGGEPELIHRDNLVLL